MKDEGGRMTAARKSTSWMGDPEDDDEDEEEEKKEQEEDEDEEENDGEEEEVPWQVAGNGWLDPIKNPAAAGSRKPARCGVSDGFQVGCRGLPVLAGLQVERDFLVLAQRAEACELDRGDMHEHVLRAVLGLDESEALG